MQQKGQDPQLTGPAAICFANASALIVVQALLQRMAAAAGVAHGGKLLAKPEGAQELAAALLAPGQRHPAAWHVRHAVSSIVRDSSRRQLVAGFLSAGVTKSARYALSKLRKAWRK